MEDDSVLDDGDAGLRHGAEPRLANSGMLRGRLLRCCSVRTWKISNGAAALYQSTGYRRTVASRGASGPLYSASSFYKCHTLTNTQPEDRHLQRTWQEWCADHLPISTS